MGEKRLMLDYATIDGVNIYEIELVESFEEPLTEDEDYLNVKRTRNCDNTDIEDYNCGGYCMNTFSWYNPYTEIAEEEGFDSFGDWAEDLRTGWGMEIADIYEYLLKVGREEILKDFPDTARLIRSAADVNEDEKLVAYRIGLVFLYDDEGCEYLEHGDFHFKQWEGDYWTDKPGGSDLRFEEETIDGMLDKVWVNSWWDGTGYDSDVILFAVKKG
jgi:hypothetical protein